VSFDSAFEHTVGLEGAYSNHPKDRGGPTKYGITEATARTEGYKGNMRDLPLLTAKQIYKRRYWDVLNLTAVDLIAPPVAAEIFDTAVNMGQGTAGVFFQRCLNVLNRSGQDYADIVVDGAVGKKTVEAFENLFIKRGSAGLRVMARLLNSLQGARYVGICEFDKTQEEFVFGWVLARVTI
jgi:lysozyme family protein